MITSFFRTSKPIHFVLITLFVLIVFILARVGNIDERINIILVLKELSLCLVCLVSVFLFNFLVNKNDLTKKNAYKVLFYSLFLGVMPITLQANNLLIANLFILLALRRIISLRSHLNIKKKLFDAAFWIGVASLFYFWAVLFFVLIIAALIFYSIRDFKNWLIPFMGLLTVTLLVLSYTIIATNTFMPPNYLDSVSFNFTDYNDINIVVGITLLISLGFWALIFNIKNLGRKGKKHRSSYQLTVIAILIGVVLVLIVPDKNGGEFIFLFAPLAIVMSNYLEALKERWFAELFVWLLILAPLSLLMLSYI